MSLKTKVSEWQTKVSVIQKQSDGDKNIGHWPKDPENSVVQIPTVLKKKL